MYHIVTLSFHETVQALGPIGVHQSCHSSVTNIGSFYEAGMITATSGLFQEPGKDAFEALSTASLSREG